MAQRAFKQEFEELAAKMPPVPDLRAANDADASKVELRALVETWLQAMAFNVETMRSLLPLATRKHMDDAIRYACDELLPALAQNAENTLIALDGSGVQSLAKELAPAIIEMREQTLALIWDFDPEAHETDGVATTPDEIDAWFRDLPLNK